MAFWNFSESFCNHFHFIVDEHLDIHHGTDGLKQVLQDSEASKIPNYFYEEVYLSTALGVWATFVSLALLSVLAFGSRNDMIPAFEVPGTTSPMPVAKLTAVVIFYSP